MKCSYLTAMFAKPRILFSFERKLDKSIIIQFSKRLSSSSFNDEVLRNHASLQSYFKPDSREDRVIKRLAKGLHSGDRACLAESITLVESTHPRKKIMGQVLLHIVLQTMVKTQVTNIRSKCLPSSCQNDSPSLRVGISGPPGAGKSTYIENLGLHLVTLGLKVAVLTIDPSSNRTGGAILGDKTRMTDLSLAHNAYIRSTSAKGALGGVARNTTEALVLCEGSGYDVIIIETVGVGQSETVVADMTDIFVMVVPPAGGDELQGLKRGIIESCDVILVSKSDGDTIPAARRIQTEYTSALKFIPRKHQVWNPCIQRISSVTGDGIEKSWKTILRFYELMTKSGLFYQQRKQQNVIWMLNHLKSSVFSRFMNSSGVESKIDEIQGLVEKSIITPGLASELLLDKYFNNS